MRQLINVDLAHGVLPDGWSRETPELSFAEGALVSGHQTKLQFRIPESGWGALRIEVELTSRRGASVTCDVFPCLMAANIGLNQDVQRINCDAIPLCVSRRDVRTAQGAYKVAFGFDGARRSIE